MKCFVTGASGFIGSNLVRELLARKHRVKALVRPGSDQHGLAGLDVELAPGDLSDPALLRREMGGCEWCFHCAASYHLWLPDYKPMYATNVEGTFNVIESAGHAGCQRIIHTSTVGCIGLPKEVNGEIMPSTEADMISATSHHERLQTLQMGGRNDRGEIRARGPAGHHREPQRACRPGRFEADAHRPDHRGLSEPRDCRRIWKRD